MICEFAAVYGWPDPELPWPLFMAGIERVSQHHAKALLEQVTAQTVGALQASPYADGSTQAEIQRLLDDVKRVAYGEKKADEGWVDNLARTDDPED